MAIKHIEKKIQEKKYTQAEIDAKILNFDNIVKVKVMTGDIFRTYFASEELVEKAI